MGIVLCICKSPPYDFCMVKFGACFDILEDHSLTAYMNATFERDPLYTRCDAHHVCGCMNCVAPISNWGEFPAKPRPFLLFKVTSP